MQENTKFKARLGFDANQNTIANVGNPKHPLDAINLDHFDYNNSITVYRTDRGYYKNFITNYNNQLYHAISDIASPAGPFNGEKWKALSSAPVWDKVDSGMTPTYQIKSGSHLAVTTERGNLVLNLPASPMNGETINIIDVGGFVGYKSLTIKSRVNNIKDPKNIVNGVIQNVDTILATVPRALYTFIYSTGFWEMHISLNDKFTFMHIKKGVTIFNAQTGMHITDKSGNEETTITLPDFASNGDIITYETTGQNNTFVEVKLTDENKTAVLDDNRRSFLFPTYTQLRFIYDALSDRWISSYSAKIKKKTLVSGLSYQPRLNEDVTVVNFPTEETTVTINLPKNAIEHDTFELFTNQTNSNISIEVVSDVDISYIPNTFGTTRFEEHNISGTPTITKSITFKPVDLRMSSILFVKRDTNWVIARTDDFNFVACPNSPEIAGIVRLVTPEEMLTDVMTRGNCAITPKLLETRISTQTRKGIVAIATQAEVNAGKIDDKFVSPLKLLKMKATTSQEGVIFLASQAEVDTGTNANKAVTSRTLDMKLPNESGKKGVVSLVSTTVIGEGTSRTTSGQGIFNFNDDTLVITPKSLHQLISSEKSIGLAYKATEAEVLAGTNSTSPLFVSPENLAKRTATESRTGIAKIATQTLTNAGVSDDTIVTPKKFMACISTEKQKGVALLATQKQVDDGTSNNIVTPITLDAKLPNDDGKKGVVSLVALTTGEGASTRETAGTGIFDFNDDKLVVTPKSLHRLVSNETNYGLVVEATLNEVLAGTLNDSTPLFVTPNKLHKRTATTTRTGLAKLTTTTTVKDATNKTDIVTPETLNSLVGTATQKGLVRYATTTDVNNKNGDSVVTPSELAKRLTSKTVTTSTSEIKLSGNFWDGIKIDISKVFDAPFSFSKSDNTLEDGYFFKIFKMGTTELTNALTWLTPPPTNKVGYDVILNGKATQAVPSGESPEYKADYLYESFTSGNNVFERITVNEVMYQRYTTYNGTVGTHNGWTMVYNSLNKPTPKEINAIDKDDIILGKVQVDGYLDIIVNPKNRLRIMPNLDSEEKVSYLWLESETGVF